MRMHINVDDALVAELDARVGRRRRSQFITELIRRALEDARRWDDIEAGLGALDETHPWDDDPATWVAVQRGSDERRPG